MKKINKPYRILVIEDNEGDFVMVEELLSQQISDPVIVHASNFKRAASILSSSDAVFDIILLDLTLPDKSGQKLITEMFQFASSCPIIILTGFSDIDFSIESISQGIADYLVKDDLNATILYKSIVYAVERRKTIAQLEQSEKRYSDLFHLSPQPMWVYDIETLNFIQVNQAAINHYGYSKEEFLCMSIMDIRPETEIFIVKQIIDFQNNEQNDINKNEFIHRKKNGDIIDVQIFSTPITIDDKRCKSVISIDITEKNLFELRLTKAIIKTQEDERYEIGGELHDNVCQILATSLLYLGMLKELLTDPESQWFTNCREYIISASAEIRNLSHRLAPAFFNDTTLEDAFDVLLKSFNVDNTYLISLQFEEAVANADISMDLQLNLYRILQEQLRNILQYSNASYIDVEMGVISDKLNMTVSDNGIGFDMSQVKGGIGRSNMKRRAELFSGSFEIRSSPGYGCKISVEIPLQKMAI